MRPFRPSDLDDFYAYRYLYGGSVTREECADLLDKPIDDHEITCEGQLLAIHLPEAGRGHRQRCAEVAQRDTSTGRDRLQPQPGFHGHGYAIEAARTMLRLGFDGLGLHRIVAECARAQA
ncbi:GNAT family N-acetyltransferase [Lentzea sp. NPDC058436]|uniref:GNAT family N-acetyltransferase n=1 Tax=Lentzea sp. NPDC058436 TaxID=3346499 RepID=UPI00364DC4CE